MKKENFQVNLGSFGHDSLWRFASLRNDKFVFKFLKFLFQSSHYRSKIDFEIWKETIKVMESYGKNGKNYNSKSISLKNSVITSILGDDTVGEFFKNNP